MYCEQGLEHSEISDTLECGSCVSIGGKCFVRKGRFLQTMKPSRYNWVLEHEGETFIFNGASGCMARIREEHKDAIGAVLASERPDLMLELVPADILKNLTEGGFLVPESLDERSVLRHIARIPRYSTELAGVTAVVTTRCNFLCPYCQQDTEQGTDMPCEVVDRLLSLIESTRSQHFSMTLYGGEPLLVPETCLDLCERTSAICGRRGMSSRLSMITNGHLLAPGLAEVLAAAGLSSVQVTLDGNQELHDSRRILKDGGPTFARIVENALAASELMDVRVRVNLDASVHRGRESIADVERLFEKKERALVYVSPTRLPDSCSTDANLSSSCGCFGDLFLARKRLHAKVDGCCAVHLDSFVLLPDGSFAFCWDEVGVPGAGHGSILERDFPAISARAGWMDWDPFTSPPCSECRWLPTCGGGCPRIWIQTGSPKCLFKTDAQYEQFIRINLMARRGEGGGEEGASKSPPAGGTGS